MFAGSTDSACIGESSASQPLVTDTMTHQTTTRQLTANGVDFTLLEIGTGPLALCLHGFPDSAHSWRYLLPELAAAGFRAVAPFMRGYAPTSVAPDGMYQTGALSADANALHEALGADENAVIIGHDWGAPSVYGAAASEPSRWKRVVGMAVPPGNAMGRAFATNLEQTKRSWYMFYFQHALSNKVVPANDLAFIDMLWRDWSPGFDGAVDAENCKTCLRDPAHLTAALGYYRASLGDAPHTDHYDAIQTLGRGELTQPTLYLHGRNDGCIGLEVAESARALCPWATIRIVDDAGHFLQLEQPATVNRLIIDWMKIA